MKTALKNTYEMSESRKIRKPMMEKKRRARINDSLEILKQMLLESKTALKESRGKNRQRTAKLEKADILEMTVSYLQQLHTKLNEIKDQHGSGIVHNQNSGVSLMPTKLSGGEFVYYFPQNLHNSKADASLKNKTVEKVSSPVDAERVWRPW